MILPQFGFEKVTLQTIADVTAKMLNINTLDIFKTIKTIKTLI